MIFNFLVEQKPILSTYVISLVCPVVIVLSIHLSRHLSHHPSIQVPHP